MPTIYTQYLPLLVPPSPTVVLQVCCYQRDQFPHGNHFCLVWQPFLTTDLREYSCRKSISLMLFHSIKDVSVNCCHAWEVHIAQPFYHQSLEWNSLIFYILSRQTWVPSTPELLVWPIHTPTCMSTIYCVGATAFQTYQPCYQHHNGNRVLASKTTLRH